MPQAIKFHLDENVNPAIAKGLRIRGVNVTTTREVGLIEAGDEEQVEFAKAAGRVVFTHDDDFLRIQIDHTGIVYCGQGRRTIGEIIQRLILIWETLDPEDMENQVEFI
jgi:uncharacterized protein with PIN domain